MKIGIFSIPELKIGKVNVKDPRLDQVNKITNSKKITYIQVELIGEELLAEADAILTPKESCADLILKDLDFIETRLSRCEEEKEKTLLNKLKNILEKEEFISQGTLSEEEARMISGYSLLTNKPVIGVEAGQLDDLNSLFSRSVKEAGYMSFFTTGEKETRAWLIKKGTTAWEASGTIHSDIQKGFIRAEIISLNDFIACGGETAAKQAGKLRLEQKDYIMQDADLTNFRFNK